MSSFGSGGDWWKGLQGLFGGGQQGGQSNAPDVGGFRRVDAPPTFSFPGGSLNRGMEMGLHGPQYWQSTGGGGQGQMPTYGQVLAGGLAQDYRNAEAARQRELGMYQGLFGNLMGSMQGAGQMVQDARQAGQQNMAGMERQAQQIRGAAGMGQQYYDEAKRQMMGGLDEARRRMDQGIGTLQTARGTYDASNRSDTAGTVMGIQQQYKNQLDQITNRSDLTQEQKDMMTGELKQSMHQQSSALAAQADAKARDTLLALDQNIGQMQSMAGTQLGQFGIGVGQALGQLGSQVAAQRQQAEEQIGSFYNNMAQFNSSLLQGAQANALQYTLNGNQLAASLIQQMPLGPMSIFETLSRMVQSGDFNRNKPVSPEMAGLFGRIG